MIEENVGGCARIEELEIKISVSTVIRSNRAMAGDRTYMSRERTTMAHLILPGAKLKQSWMSLDRRWRLVDSMGNR
jgi:hypothetical protein